MINQKIRVTILVVLVAIAAVLGTVFYFVRNQAGKPPTQPAGQTTQGSTNSPQAAVPAINNSQDLTTAAGDLDNTDVDGLSTQLDQNAADAQTF